MEEEQKMRWGQVEGKKARGGGGGRRKIRGEK